MRDARYFRRLVMLAGLVLLPWIAAAPACAQDADQTLRQTQPESVTAAEVEADRWYEIWIGDGRAGWAHEMVTREGDTIVTTSTQRLQMGRAEQTVEVFMRSEFVETARGEPVEVRTEQRLGPTPIQRTFRFTDDGVVMIQNQNGAEQKTTLPAPEGEWLPPAAAGRYVAQRLESGAKEITVRTLDPSNGLVIMSVTRSNIAPGTTEVNGESVDCLAAESRTLVGPTPIRGKEWLLPDGTVLRTEMSMGGLRMTTAASSRERALEAFEPTELMVSTFVRPDRAIPRPRAATRAVYVVRVPGGEMPALPSSAYQQAEALDASTARVTLDTTRRTPAPEVDREAFLASTTYADTGDDLLRQLTAKAIAKAGPEPEDVAEALRRFVFAHITAKDFSTAFATASEVARSCQGDCSEHGVLLAAMLRVAGIPSRVAVGVVYVERFAGERDVFGYHMWTQALLDTDNGPAWVDLDATLDPRTPFDATHIALATSDLAEGQTVSQLAGIAPMLGTLEIEVEEAR